MRLKRVGSGISLPGGHHRFQHCFFVCQYVGDQCSLGHNQQYRNIREIKPKEFSIVYPGGRRTRNPNVGKMATRQSHHQPYAEGRKGRGGVRTGTTEKAQQWPEILPWEKIRNQPGENSFITHIHKLDER